jgi:hypothetical protein
MRSLQDYRDLYRSIASNLNLQGDSVEVLVQMLANASYISEVENVAYVQEASLEKASLMNSKIQHCMNNMYSVYRGQCPRIIMRLKPNKYFSLSLFDEIVTSNNFSIYYLGYLPEEKKDYEESESDIISSQIKLDYPNFKFAPITIPPSTDSEPVYYTIIGFLASDKVELDEVTTEGQYYIECTEDGLSNDMYVKIDDSGVDVTRNFSDHILKDIVFDLTLPSNGSRLYLPNPPYEANKRISATYYKYTTLDSVNSSELKRAVIKGAELVDFDSEWMNNLGYEELTKGLITLKSKAPDEVSTIHYKANRDRYVNSILRSNSDIGTLLEEYFPDIVISGGTTYNFTSNDKGESLLTIYYIPKGDKRITLEDKDDFVRDRYAYFVTDELYINPGICYDVVYNIEVELFENQSVNDEIKSILSNYSHKFNINLETKSSEISSLLSKIANVKIVNSITKDYTRNGELVTDLEKIYKNSSNVYFNISTKISSIIKSS